MEVLVKVVITGIAVLVPMDTLVNNVKHVSQVNYNTVSVWLPDSGFIYVDLSAIPVKTEIRNVCQLCGVLY
jgi:hypothetical protein